METMNKVATNGTWIVCVVILTSFLVSADATCSKVQVYNDKYLDDKLFNTFLMEELAGIEHLVRCTKLCQQESECMSFCYSEEEGKCRLHRTGFHRQTDGTDAKDWACYKHSDTNCPVQNGFVHIRSSNLCIHVAPGTYTYTDARDYCANKNSNIISLSTTSKRQAFENLLKTVLDGRFEKVKIGLTKVEYVWTWENGHPLGTESQWHSGQPYCGGNNPCSCVSAQYTWDWRWNDHNCADLLPVLCEVELA